MPLLRFARRYPIWLLGAVALTFSAWVWRDALLLPPAAAASVPPAARPTAPPMVLPPPATSFNPFATEPGGIQSPAPLF